MKGGYKPLGSTLKMMLAQFISVPTGTTEIFVNPANIFAITPHPEQVGVTMIIGIGGASVCVRQSIPDLLNILRGKANGRT